MKRYNEKIPCVVLGLGVNGLGVVRSLGRKKLKVIGLYTKNEEIGRYSKYCKAIKFLLLENNQEGFLDSLLDLGRKLKKTKIYATTDKYVQFISENRGRLSEYFFINMAKKELISKMNSKSGIQQLAKKYNIKMPQTRHVLNMSDLEKEQSGL